MLSYEIKVAYERQTGENTPGKVKETYLLEGVNCADVENRLMDEIKPYISGDCEVTSCRKAQYMEIFPSPNAQQWYKARVEMITVQDDGKETRKTVSILIASNTISEALKSLVSQLSTLDCEIVSIQRSPIIEVFRAIK